MSELLTREHVRAMLLEIVAEFPEDHVYEAVSWLGAVSCVYAVDGCPSCLIGHLFHRLNVTVPGIHQAMPVHFVVHRHVVGVFTDHAVQYMANVQEAQDARMSWVKAVEFADKVVADRLRLFNRSADAAPPATV